MRPYPPAADLAQSSGAGSASPAALRWPPLSLALTELQLLVLYDS